MKSPQVPCNPSLIHTSKRRCERFTRLSSVGDAFYFLLYFVFCHLLFDLQQSLADEWGLAVPCREFIKLS